MKQGATDEVELRTGPDTDAMHHGIWSREFICVWLATALVMSSAYFLVPVLPECLINIGGRTGQVGWLTGLLTGVAMVCRPIGGRLTDRRGKTWTMRLGVCLLVITMLLYLVVRTPAELFVVRGLHGLGWAFYLTAAITHIADLAHPQRRALVVGQYFLANTIAMIFGPWGGAVLRKHTSTTAVFYVALGMTMVALIPVGWLHQGRRQDPLPKSVSGWICPAAMLPSWIYVFTTFSLGGLIAFLPLYAQHYQLANVGLFFSSYGIAMALGRPVLGGLSDRIGREAVIGPSFVVMAGSLALLAWLPSSAGLVVSGIFYGLSFGGLASASAGWVTDRVPAGARGMALGNYSAGFELGQTLGSVSLGMVLVHSSFPSLWLVAALSPLGGLALLAASRWWKKRPA